MSRAPAPGCCATVPTVISADLLRDRWMWTDRAVAWMNNELYGAGRPAPDTGGTNVMVLGTTRAGKTTVLLHLLGVTDPERVRAAHRVLAAGRLGSESNTTAPTRYRWSRSSKRWALDRDGRGEAQLLTGDELIAELARLRPAGTVRWDVAARPLEIGVPTGLAGHGERRELRILDLPGTFARDEAEQRLARELVARFAPRMAVVLFVFKAHDMTMLQHEEIASDPFLRSWAGHPERFRLVPTGSFEDAWTRDQVLAAVRRGGPEAGSDATRRLVAEQLAGTLYDDPGRVDALLPFLYPVDIGKTWRKLPKDVAKRLRPARDLVIEQLATSLTRADAPDSERFDTPRLALRVAEELQADAYDRAARRALLTDQLRAAERDRDRHAQLRVSAQADASTARAYREKVAAARSDLAARPIDFVRPERPDMSEGAAVRASQEDERLAWADAARRLWTSWRLDHPELSLRRATPLDEAAIRAEYDRRVTCCQQCGRSFRASYLVPLYGLYRQTKDRAEPERTCYRRMTDAGSGLREWITERLCDPIDKAIEEATDADDAASDRLATVERIYDRAFRRAAELTRRLDRTRQEDDAADEFAAAQRATAGKLRLVLDQENQAYVRQLAHEVRYAPAGDHGWYAAAALRAVLDLNLMLAAD
jgi:hypothetical protein